MIQIIDNILPEELANNIEETLFSTVFPWYFLDDVTNGSIQDDSYKVPAFCHYYVRRFQVNSDYYALVQPIWNVCVKKIENKNPTIMGCRSFLQLPITGNNERNTKHVDADVKHIVFLYYVNDVDGNTIIYKPDSDEVLMEVTPKKNRVVIFNGDYYHCSSNPTEGKRAVVNFISLI